MPPPPEFCNTHIMSRHGRHIVHNVGGAVREKRKRAKKELDKQLGMTPEVFREFLDASHLSTKSAAEVWDKHYGFCLDRDRGKIPARVRYHRPCLGVCSQDLHLPQGRRDGCATN